MCVRKGNLEEKRNRRAAEGILYPRTPTMGGLARPPLPAAEGFAASRRFRLGIEKFWTKFDGKKTRRIVRSRPVSADRAGVLPVCVAERSRGVRVEAVDQRTCGHAAELHCVLAACSLFGSGSLNSESNSAKSMRGASERSGLAPRLTGGCSRGVWRSGAWGRGWKAARIVNRPGKLAVTAVDGLDRAGRVARKLPPGQARCLALPEPVLPQSVDEPLDGAHTVSLNCRSAK